MPSVDVLPLLSSDSDLLAKALISLDDMSAPLDSKEGGDEKSPPRRSNSSSLQNALTTQDITNAFERILESSDNKAKKLPVGSPFQSLSSINEEDWIKFLASSDSVSAFRTAGSLLKQLSKKDNNESSRTKPSLLRSSSETFSSKDSLANALDWTLLRQLSTSKHNIPEKPPAGLKRKASDAFSSKDSLFASSDLALLRQLSSSSKSGENPEIPSNRKRSGSDVFGSKDSIANALASSGWALLRQMSTSSKTGEVSSETNKTGSSKGAALSGLFASKDSITNALASSDWALLRQMSTSSKTGEVSSESNKSGSSKGAALSGLFASKDALQSLASALPSEDWCKEFKRQHVDIKYAPKDVFEGDKSARRQCPYVPPPAPKFSPKESTASMWLSGYYQEAAATVSTKKKPTPTTATVSTKKKPTPTLPTKAKTNAVSTNPTKSKKKASNPSGNKQRSSRHSRREPEVKIYVEPTDRDVLFGRGGKSNNHPGNKVYREELEKLKPLYKTSDKSEKTDLAQLLIDTIKDKRHGRFLQRDEDGKYFQVDNVVARRKASQALREENTAQSRQAKRAKYSKN